MFVMVGLNNWYVLLIAPIVYYYNYTIFKQGSKCKKDFEKLRNSQDTKMWNVISENNNGASTIKAFGTQRVFNNKFNKIINDNMLSMKFQAGIYEYINLRVLFWEQLFMIAQTASCTFNIVDQVITGMTLSYVMRFSHVGI